MNDILKPFEEKMQKSITAMEADFNTIRAGRANPRVLDKITVDYYGTDTPLNQVGNVTVPEPRLLQITPWDKGMLKNIEKAIQASELGINPSSDGTVVRIVFPELTEERRKALSKDVKKKGEEYKIAVRNIRRVCMDDIKKLEKKSEITEDDRKDYEDKLQKLTDKYVGEIDKLADGKIKDIMSI